MIKKLKVILAVLSVAIICVGSAAWALDSFRPAPMPFETATPEVSNSTVPAIPAQENESIRFLNIKNGDTIKSPLNLKGEARGIWFFEGSFPIQVVNEKGRQLGQGIAHAKGDWMKTTYVPFEATITYAVQESSQGMVIFSKDNPSGLPENAADIVVNVKFTSTQKPFAVAAGSCHPTGCSNQICSDTDVVSTCEYRNEYACYKTATCARQSDGKCAWTQTPALKKCIEAALKDTPVQ